MSADRSMSQVPATVAALRAGMSREAMIRRVQTGEIAGGLADGRWVVFADALVQWIRDNSREPAPAA